MKPSRRASAHRFGRHDPNTRRWRPSSVLVPRGGATDTAPYSSVFHRFTMPVSMSNKSSIRPTE